MLINTLFKEKPVSFERKCKLRIITAALITFLGLTAVVLSFITKNQVFALYLKPGHHDFVAGFYVGTGFGLMGAGIATVIKNIRYLKNPVLNQKQKILESDERNRMIGLRCCAYTGYTMMFVLYIGMLISGFFNVTVLATLLAVACFSLILLLFFKILLQKTM